MFYRNYLMLKFDPTDPLFVDPLKGDFRLRPESPARKVGFVPLEGMAR